MKTEFRHEYKYLCSREQTAVLESRLQKLLRPDPHARDGRYQIRSLYFNTPDNDCFYENENGTDPRAKYRMRIYNCKASPITLERKLKCRGMTHKDAGPLTMEQAEALLAGKIPALTAGMDPMLRRMLTDMRLKAMRPTVIVQYERTPFIYGAGNVRITLDGQIESSRAFARFFRREIPLRPVLPEGRAVLEVKWDQFLPSYIYDSLQLEGMEWTSFSKYYVCRKYNVNGGAKA